MINSQEEYYRKLQRYIQVRHQLAESHLKEIGDGLTKPIPRHKLRVADSKEESLKPFDEKREPTQEEYNQMLKDDILFYEPIDKVREGSRIPLEKEKKELLDELVEFTNYDLNEFGRMKYSSLPKKHFRYFNGFKHFLWNGIEFKLNQGQAKTLELIYHNYLNNDTKIFQGNAFTPITDSAGNRNINKHFRGTEVIGTIILNENKNQSEYRLDIDF